MEHRQLKDKHRQIRDGLPNSLSFRIHRALSWLDRSEQVADDPDSQFIFLWIAFNAAYGHEIDDRNKYTESRILLHFLGRLIESDEDNLLYKIVWNQYSSSIRLLIDNQYVFRPFWRHQLGEVAQEEWQAAFRKSQQMAHRALGKMNTKKVMAVLFDRLYVLRNQLMHGSATWNGGVNRQQVNDGAMIMSHLVPVIIHIMLHTKQPVWGDIAYPVVDGDAVPVSSRV